MWRGKGRKKNKGDPVNDPAFCSDEFYDGVIVLAAILKRFGTTMSKDCSDGNPAGSLKELLGWTGLGAFLVAPNHGPVERGW